MRLSDARYRQRQTKLLYPHHRLHPLLTEAATRDGSNRLLDATTSALPWLNQPWSWRKQRMTLRHMDRAPPPVQHPTSHG